MASGQDHNFGASSPAAHKPTIMEQVKEKVSVVKDKLTGHEHHPSAAAPFDTHTTTPTTTAQSPKSPKKGESMMQKIKDKLPGSHAHTSTTTTTPVHTQTTKPATGDHPHHESIGEKTGNVFKPGHSDGKTTHQKEAHGVTEQDTLK